MPYYMFQVAYTSEAWGAQVRNPQDRSQVAARLLEALGGRLAGAYYSFGEYDVVFIAELPDNVSMSAAALAVAAGGSAKATKTTPLMTVEEGMAAMRRAGELGTTYQPPR